VYFDGELLEIALVTCVQTAALVAVVRAGSSGSRLEAAVAGIALGLGCVARPVLLLFAPCALVWLGRRRALPAVVGLIAAIAPVTAHNAVHGRDFVPIASNLGLNLYIGNNPWADGRVSTTPELPAEPARARVRAQEVAEAARGRALRPSEVSSYWQGRALEYALSHPGRTLALLGRKLYYAGSGWPISDNEDLGGLGRYLHLYAVLPVRMWLLVPLGLVGLIAARSRAPRELNLVRAYAVAQMAATLPFFVVERFRMPWTPVLAICAGWTLTELWDRARARRPSLGLVLGTAVALALCNLPLFGVRAAPLFDLDYKIAYAYQQKGRMPEAIAAYRDAVQRNPQAALARNALGYLMAERGEDLDQAVQLIEAALALDPTHTANYAESLAFAEIRRGNAAAALAACSRGLGSSPEPPTRAALLLRRAEAHVLAGDRDAARADVRAALEVAPEGEVANRARAKLAELGMESELQTRPPGP
jgi:tetratricopeptide (TPR) repeat protein